MPRKVVKKKSESESSVSDNNSSESDDEEKGIFPKKPTQKMAFIATAAKKNKSESESEPESEEKAVVKSMKSKTPAAEALTDKLIKKGKKTTEPSTKNEVSLLDLDCNYIFTNLIVVFP